MSNELIDVTIVTGSDTDDIQIIENKIINIIQPTIVEMVRITTPLEFEKDPTCMDSMKLPQIRETLKFYKNSMVIPVTFSAASKRDAKNAAKKMHDFALVGSKLVLLERLKKYMRQEAFATRIQRVVRGNFVRRANNLRGPARFDRSICVNDTDFYSLEPLKNIPFYDFFSYTDENSFTYGFEFESLMIYMKRRSKNIKNPYNRDNIDQYVPLIRKLERLIKIINTHYTPQPRSVIPPVSRIVSAIPGQSPANTSRNRRVTPEPTVSQYNHTTMIETIRTIRARPFRERVAALFMEIDQLGNYTQHQWFSDLDLRGCLRFFRILKDIWTYRAQIPTSVKSKICPLWDPFVMIATNSISMVDLNFDQVQNVCLSVIEDMIYTGVDVEYKTLGAFHVLSALTVVNRDARANMPWLYESLVW